MSITKQFEAQYLEFHFWFTLESYVGIKFEELSITKQFEAQYLEFHFRFKLKSYVEIKFEELSVTKHFEAQYLEFLHDFSTLFYGFFSNTKVFFFEFHCQNYKTPSNYSWTVLHYIIRISEIIYIILRSGISCIHESWIIQ